MTHENCARKFISEVSIREKMSNPGTFSCKECIVNPTINAEPKKDNLVESFESEEQLMLEMSFLPPNGSGLHEASEIARDITTDIINASSSLDNSQTVSYGCDQCEKTFPNESDINSHFLSDHVEVGQPKPCNECPGLRELNEKQRIDASVEIRRVVNECDNY